MIVRDYRHRQCEYYYENLYGQCENSSRHPRHMIAMQIGTGHFSARVVAHETWIKTMRLNLFDDSGKQTKGWHTRATLSLVDNIVAGIHYQKSKRCTIRSQSTKSCSSKSKKCVKVYKKRMGKRTRVGAKQAEGRKKQTKITQKRITNGDGKKRTFGTENIRWSRRRDHICNAEM